jgi:thiaminase (transcriptional activator TenA)
MIAIKSEEVETLLPKLNTWTIDWSESALTNAEPILDQITKSIFVNELRSGKLNKEQFENYLTRDFEFSVFLAKAMITVAGRLSDSSLTLEFMNLAESVLLIENRMNDYSVKDYNMVNKLNLPPACHYYVCYLLHNASMEPPEVAIASILPAFLVHQYLTMHLRSRLKNNHPYKSQINAYNLNNGASLVNRLKEICNDLARAGASPIQADMTKAFILSCRLEKLMLDGAWQLEKWQY